MPLSAEATRLEDNRVRLDVAVPEEEVRKEMDRAVREVARDVRVPGFRPGKAPAEVVLQRVGREAIVQEMLKSAIGGWYAQAVADTGVRPIDDPELDLEGVPDEGDLTFTATVEVRPKAALGRYRGLEVGRAEPEVPEGALEEQLERLREQAGSLAPVERPAGEGDFVVIDFDGSADGERIAQASARDHVAQLGGGRLVPEFDRALTGMSAGETTTFPVSYDESDQRPELAGRTVEYTVTVKAVQERVLPPLDDDLAAQVSEFDTLEELRSDVERRLREAAESRVDELFRRMVIDAATEEATVEVPRVMVDRRVGTILQQTAQQLPEGVSFEDYLSATGRSLEEIVEELRPDAEMALRRELVVEAIAEDEDIQVSDEDVEAQVREDAEATGRAPERLLHELREHGGGNGFEALRQDLRLKRAVDLLIREAVPIPMEQAEAREKLWTPDDARREAAGEEQGRPAQQAGRLWTPGDPR